MTRIKSLLVLVLAAAFTIAGCHNDGASVKKQAANDSPPVSVVADAKRSSPSEPSRDLFSIPIEEWNSSPTRLEHTLDYKGSLLFISTADGKFQDDSQTLRIFVWDSQAPEKGLVQIYKGNPKSPPIFGPKVVVAREDAYLIQFTRRNDFFDLINVSFIYDVRARNFTEVDLDVGFGLDRYKGKYFYFKNNLKVEGYHSSGYPIQTSLGKELMVLDVKTFTPRKLTPLEFTDHRGRSSNNSIYMTALERPELYLFDPRTEKLDFVCRMQNNPGDVYGLKIVEKGDYLFLSTESGLWSFKLGDPSKECKNILSKVSVRKLHGGLSAGLPYEYLGEDNIIYAFTDESKGERMVGTGSGSRRAYSKTRVVHITSWKVEWESDSVEYDYMPKLQRPPKKYVQTYEWTKKKAALKVPPQEDSLFSWDGEKLFFLDGLEVPVVKDVTYNENKRFIVTANASHDYREKLRFVIADGIRQKYWEYTITPESSEEIHIADIAWRSYEE